ncbi:MAG: sugar transferase [Pseudomonadota bacterium]|nr:sugar transferase [Pseudomonadota bacterium]
MDLGLAVILLPFVALIGVGLIFLNRRYNPGPLLFVQTRLGRAAVPFQIYKFRTMAVEGSGARGALDPLDVQRIGALGAWLRRSRFDELPQVINILRGEMSFIGPRPDQLDHAEFYVRHLPFYAGRLNVLPGISGLAQVTLGYAEGLAQTRAKARRDLVYVRHASFWLDARITWLTLISLVQHSGR